MSRLLRTRIRPPRIQLRTHPTTKYDGIVFVQEISPAHPTADGLANAAAGRGL